MHYTLASEVDLCTFSYISRSVVSSCWIRVQTLKVSVPLGVVWPCPAECALTGNEFCCPRGLPQYPAITTHLKSVGMESCNALRIGHGSVARPSYRRTLIGCVLSCTDFLCAHEDRVQNCLTSVSFSLKAMNIN